MHNWTMMIREGGKYVPVEKRYLVKQGSRRFMRLVEKYSDKIRRHFKNIPTTPIRFEVDDPSDDERAITTAVLKLCRVKSVGDDYLGLPLRIGRAEIPMRNGRHKLRLAVYVSILNPIKIERGPRRSIHPEDHELICEYNGEPATRSEIPMLKQRDKLKNKYGPSHHVSVLENEEGYIFEIWRGEDWLDEQSAALYPAEVANKIDEAFYSRHEAEMNKPFLDKYLANVRTNRVNASKDTGNRGYVPYNELVRQLTEHKKAGLTYEEAEVEVTRDARNKLPRHYSHYRIRERIQRHEHKAAQDFYATL